MILADGSNLVRSARRARERAYCPYSNFRVGAAVLGDDGRVYEGCNVENASYGLTICAERVAVVAAVSAGCRRILALAVAAGEREPAPPCGACLQVLSEFAAPDLPIRLVPATGDMDATAVFRLQDLLPHGFRLDNSTSGTPPPDAPPSGTP